MAIIRVTPATALAQVRQFGTDLARIVADAGPLAAAPHLPRQIDQLLQACAPGAALPVEVWIDDGTDAAAAASWLLGGTTRIAGRLVDLVFASSARPVPVATGHLAPPVTVWIHGDGPPAADLPALDDRSLLVTTRRAAAGGDGAACEQIVVERGAPDGVLQRVLGGPSAASPDLLHADAAARAVVALAGVAGLAFEQEARAIRAKRALAQQRVASSQHRSPSTALADVVGGLRTRLQRVFTDLSRGVDDRFASAIGSPNAPFWAELETELAGIDRIEREARVKTVATRLPADVEARWAETVGSRLRQHCLADLAALRDTLRAAAHEIERAVADAGGPPVVVQFPQVAEERLSRVLDSHLVVQRRYQGELPQHGFFEYMMMARRYQTLVFMLLSAFGLSFVRSYREVMVPIAILLLSLGVLQMVHSVRRERAEGQAKELEKARETLRGETRRIVADLQRAWPAVIAQHVNDQLPIVLGQVDASVRDHLNRLAADGTEERQRVQRQLQAFEASERKLAGPQKLRETMAQSVAQVRGELRQLIAAAVRGAAA